MTAVVSRNKVKNIEILGSSKGKKETLVNRLYDGIVKGKYADDEAAMQDLFPEDEEQRNKYRKLKYRLTRQLINTTFFIDTKQAGFTDRAKAFYNCYRDFSAAYILLTRGAYQSSFYLLKRVLEHAEHYEFIELAAEVCSHLRKISGRFAKSKQEVKKMTELHRKYERMRHAEAQAFDYYEDLAKDFSPSNKDLTKINKTSSAYYDHLHPFMKEEQSSAFSFYLSQIGYIKYVTANDSASLIQLNYQILPDMLKKKGTSAAQTFTIVAQRLECLTQMRQAVDANNTNISDYCLNLSKPMPGAATWSNAHLLSTYNAFYTQNYKRALELFKSITASPLFKNLPETTQEKWRLIAGYLHLLAELDQLDKNQVREIAGEFKFNKFINDFEHIDRDKGGLNIPLILLPILYQLSKGNFHEDFGRSIVALEKYRTRYLNTEANARSATFLKMLLAFSRAPFEPAAAARLISRHLEKLKTQKLAVIGQEFVVEVIPYEDLWEMLYQKTGAFLNKHMDPKEKRPRGRPKKG